MVEEIVKLRRKYPYSAMYTIMEMEKDNDLELIRGKKKAKSIQDKFTRLRKRYEKDPQSIKNSKITESLSKYFEEEKQRNKTVVTSDTTYSQQDISSDMFSSQQVSQSHTQRKNTNKQKKNVLDALNTSINDHMEIEKLSMARKMVDLTFKYGLSSEEVKGKIEEVMAMFSALSGDRPQNIQSSEEQLAESVVDPNIEAEE
jgi:hypothetical protein